MDPLLPVAPSPTGEPRIPPALVPWLQVLYPILVTVGAQLGLPGPWTPDRYFTVAAVIVAGLLGMSSAGNRVRR